ncbi:MAG: ABC transporter permease [Spirochaetes bacterium]|nr:ABC transporter permease [Spirochaetota bacterium]MBU1080287.1 ABC transporter permease [Spirochaetota bacterium]
MTSAAAMAAIGSTLYLASYFAGGLLALAALAIFGFLRRSELGAEGFAAASRSMLKAAAVPAIGIASALAIGAAVMLATGYDPVASYAALFYGGLVRNWHISVLNATPLIFTGLAISFGFKGGLFNIGAEGQYFVGVMAATWLGLKLNLPAPLGVPLVFVVGMLAGAAANLIPAALKVKTGAHEVVTTMMMAYAIRTLSPMFIRANGGDPASSAHPYATAQIGERLWLPLFKDVLPASNYRLHVGVLVAVAAAFAVRFVLDRTDLGFKIRAVGHNPIAARTQGISTARITFATLLISGALASMAGVTQVLGLDHRMFQNLNAGYGWNGISIALLARNDPIAIVFAALLWGVLDAGGQYMARTASTPNAIIEIVKSVILFLLLAEVVYSSSGAAIKRFLAGRKAARAASEGGRS